MPKSSIPDLFEPKPGIHFNQVKNGRLERCFLRESPVKKNEPKATRPPKSEMFCFSRG